MKFLLVAINAKYIHSNPGVYSLKRYAESIYEAQDGAGNLGGRYPKGQGLLCASALDYEKSSGQVKRTVQVEIAEYTIHFLPEQILEDIFQRKPDAVGFSCYIWNITFVLGLIHDLHKILPDTDIWLGGPEVSFDSYELLKQEPEVLGIMKGEGEETFATLLNCYEKLGTSVRKANRTGTLFQETNLQERFMQKASQLEIPSSKETSAQKEISAQKETSIQKEISFPKETRIKNVRDSIKACGMDQLLGVCVRTLPGSENGNTSQIRDSKPGPRVDMNKIPFLYQNLEDFENRIIYYETSRGCPFSCSYCLSSIDKSIRFRQWNLVKQELDFFLKQKVKQVKFVDRTFNCKKSHAMAIWQYIQEHDNGITNFHFEIGADLLDFEELELIGKMRKGLIQLEIGVQSTNPNTIQAIHRKMDLEKLKKVVAQIHAGGNVHQHLDLIAGLPWENYESFHRSFCDVYAMKPDQLQLGFLKVLKGSLMYEKAKEYELLYEEKPPYEVLSTHWLSYEEIRRLKEVEDMVEVYYNSGQFSHTLRRLVLEFKDPFVMFEQLATYYKTQGLKGKNHSRMARYEILYHFMEQKADSLTNNTFASLADALVCDCYLRENCKSRPIFALDQKPYKEKIRGLCPELHRLGTQIHVEALRCEEIWMFDYRQRDSLTKNALMKRLE